MNYQVPESLLKDITNYLITRPWMESNNLLVLIDELVKAQKNKEAATE